jgi:hypothetical protein
MRLGVVLLALALCACEEKRTQKGPIDRAAAAALFEEMPIDAPPGMSDLTVDEHGVLWAISERDRIVLEIELGKPPVRHPLEGVTLGLDTEAILALGGGRFAIGVEGGMTPLAAILTAELRGNAVVVTSTRPLRDKDLGIALTINHGIEALCGRDGELLAAAETVGKLPDGRRWAPLVRLRGDDVHTARLYLTTKAGKISAMYCTIADDGTAQVTAIERHFGVARLLTFTAARDSVDITPEVAIDLFPILHDNFNLEGVTKLPDGRLVLINDNQNKAAEGPTQLFVFRARGTIAP